MPLHSTVDVTTFPVRLALKIRTYPVVVWQKASRMSARPARTHRRANGLMGAHTQRVPDADVCSSTR